MSSTQSGTIETHGDMFSGETFFWHETGDQSYSTETEVRSRD